MHLLEHVEIVIRGSPVRPERNVHAKLHRPGHTRKTAPELHVARRVVDERDTLLGHDPKVIVRAPHAVRGISAAVEKTRIRKIGYRRLAVAGDALFVFLLRLAHVDVKRTLKFFVRRRECAAELLVR